jgi:hypothetical protein
MTFDEIVWQFRQEFAAIAEHFYVNTLSLAEAKTSKNKEIIRPGVYVLWTNGDVIKVGRAFDNARKRALTHMPADTGGKLAALGADAGARAFFFTLKDDKLHWAPALEVFFERALKPEVPSKRLG